MKKFLLVLAAAVLAAAAFFLYSLATVELPEMEGGASSQAYGDVAPIQGRPESASSAPAEPAADLSFLSEEQQNVFCPGAGDGDLAGGPLQPDEPGGKRRGR